MRRFKLLLVFLLFAAIIFSACNYRGSAGESKNSKKNTAIYKEALKDKRPMLIGFFAPG